VAFRDQRTCRREAKPISRSGDEDTTHMTFL
jgi:hypothetical protein